MYDLPETAILYASDSRGIYIPQYFAESIKRECVSCYSPVKWAILRHGPDDEFYWDTWEEVLNSAIVTDSEGNQFYLYLDGDLWLVPVDHEFGESE